MRRFIGKLRNAVFFAISCSLLVVASLAAQPARVSDIATFSIVASDTSAGELGVAVQSKFLAVGSVVPWAQAELGALATQAWGNPAHGPKAMELLTSGLEVEQIIKLLTRDDVSRERRQIGLIDARGRSAAFTGREAFAYAGHLIGAGFSVQGNLLSGPEVLQAMAEAFRAATGALAGRMLAALAAGQRAGGDRRGQQSAALLVVRRGGGYGGYNDRYIDLRVDDHAEPIQELTRLYALHEQTAQVVAHLRLGAELKKNKKSGAARREFERALGIARQYDDNFELVNRVAWNLAQQDEFLPETLILIQHTLALNDTIADYWDTLAEVQARMHRYDEAIGAQQKAIQLQPERVRFQERLKNWQALSKN